MDEKRLSNEIICCRVAVRRARVAVIRKIIKKMKILKTCKLETVKEKKFRKSERLFKKIQIMKKVKDDEVTKFALRHQDLEVFLKGPDLDPVQNALACLAKHEAVLKRVNSIKHQISNWERELPILLDSLEKIEGEMVKEESNSSKTAKMKKQKPNKGDKIKGSLKLKPEMNSAKKMLDKHKLRKDKSENIAESVLCTNEKIKKIEDPFFIEKKVIAPKLVTERFSNKKNDIKTNILQKFHLKKDNDKVFHEKPFKRNYNVEQINTQKSMPEKLESEKLHPSWAAKKVKLIKPFQGKKIKFSDD